VDWTFNFFARHLGNDAIVIIDDYSSGLHRDKLSLIKPTVDRLCSLGYLDRWGLLAGTTWVGKAGPRLSEFTSGESFVTLARPAEPPLCIVRLPDEYLPFSDEATDHQSPLILLEDDLMLGPRHVDYDSAQRIPGAYVHWGDHIAFSASDGSDPRVNGREYAVVHNGHRRRMIIA
jgi:hypothetical protein